jgi:hypothetical protein
MDGWMIQHTFGCHVRFTTCLSECGSLNRDSHSPVFMLVSSWNLKGKAQTEGQRKKIMTYPLSGTHTHTRTRESRSLSARTGGRTLDGVSQSVEIYTWREERRKKERRRLGCGGNIYRKRSWGPRTVKRAEEEHSHLPGYLYKRAKFIVDTQRATKQVQEAAVARRDVSGCCWMGEAVWLLGRG